MRDRANPYCANRLFEWTMAVALTGIGLHLMIWPASADVTAFKFAIAAFGVHKVAVFYFIVGTMRIVSLARNGNWPRWGWAMRAVGSGGGALIWSQMGVALFYYPPSGPPSPFIWIYASLVAAEVFSTYRAVRDGLR